MQGCDATQNLYPVTVLMKQAQPAPVCQIDYEKFCAKHCSAPVISGYIMIVILKCSISELDSHLLVVNNHPILHISQSHICGTTNTDCFLYCVQPPVIQTCKQTSDKEKDDDYKNLAAGLGVPLAALAALSAIALFGKLH